MSLFFLHSHSVGVQLLLDTNYELWNFLSLMMIALSGFHHRCFGGMVE